MRRWPLLLVVLYCIPQIGASSGDRLPEYQSCLASFSSRAPIVNSWAEDLFQWTPLAQAKYWCMHQTNDQTERQQGRTHQYYGKWPFRRLLGLQEPASVLFSLMNLYAHAKYIRILARLTPQTAPPWSEAVHLPRDIGYWYAAAAIFGVNTWVWSTIFHTRDLPWTEKMDYFSAAAGILYSVVYSLIRIGCITQWRYRLPICLLGITIFICHVLYLTSGPRFDYQYNMLFNVTAGATFNLLWIGWGGLQYLRDPRRRFYAWRPVAWAFSITAAMALEIFDFPPLFQLVDAHALWHLATVPLIGWWYRFLLIDTEWHMQTRSNVKKRLA